MKIANDTKKRGLSRLGIMGLALAVAAFTLVMATLNGNNRAGESEPLTVGGTWARPALAGGNSAVYMKLINNTREPLRITGATSDVAAAVELHETAITPESVMQMRPVQSVEVPPRKSIEFRPGGLHLMLLGLRRPLNEGDEFTLELKVEGLDPVSVRVPVQLLGDDAGGSGAGHEGHAGNDGSGNDGHAAVLSLDEHSHDEDAAHVAAAAHDVGGHGTHATGAEP